MGGLLREEGKCLKGWKEGEKCWKEGVGGEEEGIGGNEIGRGGKEEIVRGIEGKKEGNGKGRRKA